MLGSFCAKTIMQVHRGHSPFMLILFSCPFLTGDVVKILEKQILFNDYQCVFWPRALY